MLTGDKKSLRGQIALLFVVVTLSIAVPTIWFLSGAMYFGLTVEPPFLPIGNCPSQIEVLYQLKNLTWIGPLLLSPFVVLQIKKLWRPKGFLFILFIIIISLVVGVILGLMGAFVVVRITVPMEMQKVCECAEDISQDSRSRACDVWKSSNIFVK